MRFSEFPFLRYVFFFLLGIVSYSWFPNAPLSFPLILIGITFLLFFVLVVVNAKRKNYKFKVMLPLLAYVQLGAAGFVFTYQKDIKNQPNHLINTDAQVFSYIATVISHDEVKPNSIANRVNIKKVNDGSEWNKMEGEVLIYHRGEQGLSPGDLIWIAGSPQEIPEPIAPFEFDYRQFMKNQQVAHRHFIGSNFKVLGAVQDNPIESFFIHVRTEILSGMDSLITDREANQIAKAILLGQKKNLEKEVSDAYITAGAMHILAVSGLHVGIVYGFFFLFFKPYRLKSKERVVYLSFIILLIWGYALLTGMSPSVMRAATMFSLMALAQMKSRNPSIFNALALSAVILLVNDPLLIYAVGFQLSYLALIGILVIQPILVKIWTPKNRIVDYLWQITTVSFAAQLATFPISAYYFHVFPTYFAFANIIAIPGAFLMMALGVPLMLFIKVPYLSLGLAWVTEKIIVTVNSLIFWFQELPASRISDIYLSVPFIWNYWLVLALVILIWIYPGKKLVYTTLGLMVILGLFRIMSFFSPNPKREIIFYSMEKGFALDYWHEGSLYWLDQAEQDEINYKVLPNRKASLPSSTFPLKAFEKENKIAFILPDEEDLMFANMEGIELPKGNPDYSFYAWQNNNWRFISDLDSLPAKNKTIKIALN